MSALTDRLKPIRVKYRAPELDYRAARRGVAVEMEESDRHVLVFWDDSDRSGAPLVESVLDLKIAEDDHQRWLILFLGEGGLWWRPNGCGYTKRISEAGRYTTEEALSKTRLRSVSEDGMPGDVMVPAPD